jgi:ATP-binding protein involved in chromosome partitioning
MGHRGAGMINKEEILEALKHLQEPSLHKSLVELGLIRDVMVRDERVSLTVVLTQEDEALKQQFQEDIKHVVGEHVPDVHIRFRMITDFEKNEMVAKLNGAEQKEPKAAKPQHTHGANLKSDILAQDSGVTFIAVASGKGGVGKSTVTVNLAVALARKGKKVGLIDADIYGFSVPDMMGINEAPKQEDQKIIPIERYGVKVISMGFFVEDNAPVIWRGPMLGKMLRNFFSEVAWGELDYVLLDLPPGTGDVALDVHQMIPQSKEILVTTPHATASFVAARAGAMAKHTNHDILGVVENMAYYQCGECGTKDYVFGRGGGAKLAEEMHTELIAQIPLGAPDNHPSEADYSPSVYKEDSETGQIYLDVAERVINKIET